MLPTNMHETMLRCIPVSRKSISPGSANFEANNVQLVFMLLLAKDNPLWLPIAVLGTLQVISLLVPGSKSFVVLCLQCH